MKDEIGTRVDVTRDMDNMPQASGGTVGGQSMMDLYMKTQKAAKESVNPIDTAFDVNGSTVPEAEFIKENSRPAFVTGVSAEVSSVPIIQNLPEDIDSLPLKDQIKAFEDQMNSLRTGRKVESFKADSYLDPQYGDETFYVKNTSGGHVQIDIGDTSFKLEKGKSEDLLKFFQLEDLKKSKDLRICLSPNRSKPALVKRLTPQEYMEYLRAEVLNQRKIEDFRKTAQFNADNPGQAQVNKPKENIRPVIYDRLNKLKLAYSDTPHKGISPVEFAEWISAENFSKQELDVMIGHVDNQELRILLNEKKKDLIDSIR